MSRVRNTFVTDETSGDTATVNSEGRLDVVQHAHPDNGNVFFNREFTADDGDFILIDLSDTTNYPHISTSYIHIEGIRIQTFASATADYSVEVGFLDNVDGTDGDFYAMWRVDGTKVVGQSFDVQINNYPNNIRCQPGFVATSNTSLADTAFQTDVNLASTLDPSTADVPSGTGDLVMRVTRTAGAFFVNVNVAYHSHA